MRLSVLEPKKTLYQGNACEVILPGEEEEISIMDFHQKSLFRLKEGVLRIRSQVGKPEVRIIIKDAVANMRGNELIVMCRVP